MPIRNQLERDLRVDLQDEPTRADHPLPVTQPACNIAWVGTGVECQAASVVVTRTRSLIAWSDNAAPDGEVVDRRVERAEVLCAMPHLEALAGHLHAAVPARRPR